MKLIALFAATLHLITLAIQLDHNNAKLAVASGVMGLVCFLWSRYGDENKLIESLGMWSSALSIPLLVLS